MCEMNGSMDIAHKSVDGWKPLRSHKERVSDWKGEVSVIISPTWLDEITKIGLTLGSLIRAAPKPQSGRVLEQ